MTQRIDLNGVWRYQPLAWTTVQADGSMTDNAENLPPAGEMALPMNWQLRGLESFDGRVRFTRRFAAPALANGARAFLVFRGVDYFADVTLNGQPVGKHAGYFQPFEFEITDLLRQGENQLQIDVDCPKEEPGAVWPDHKWIIKGILNHWDARPGSWELTTGQEQNSGGIWGEVYVETRPAAFVANVRAASTLTPREASTLFSNHDDLATSGLQAIVRVELDVDSTMAGLCPLRVALDDNMVEMTIPVQRGRTHHVVVLHVADPRLWWPWDIGEPYLYELAVTLGAGESEVSHWATEFGVRQINLDPHTGEWTVNGRRFFVRGANVIPTLWLGEYDAAMIGRDIELLKAAHINGVRVCVHINRDEFYSACDRAGIIVWQDFALQWAYTTDPRFTQEAVRQVQEMVNHLYNHACIALWCTQNESSFHNKVILNPVLAQAAAQCDSSRYVRATSEFSEHAYPGWYVGEMRDYGTLPGAPILTEFGAQALPSADEVRQMRGGDQWPPDFVGLAYHDFQYDQTFYVAGIEMGASLEEFVENSQRYQADLLKFAIERYRRHKYEKIGSLFQFMFMDCWPSITWSVLSYARAPKQGYHTLQQVYQPVLVGADIHREKVLIGVDRGSHPRPLQLPCWVVNDRHAALEACRLHVRLLREDSVITQAALDIPGIAADSVTTLGLVTVELPEDLAAGACVLDLSVLHAGERISHNTYPVELVRPAA
ncbi:glycoside hydrolase family 2 TIM barrel-domain containing protein [Caldilinea sp.]|uniref:glycoside hydrolase family 2 protein n=1 Tax=Caldilinea sp. TaxID=2293560 RepID=UPI002B8C741C|nr:glycoside hydrolase family 2 TIM barrel-domain containing protein [Caldilinea sp.]